MTDGYTFTTRLCDDDGIVRSGPLWFGSAYRCTGAAYYNAQHVQCTSPAHGALSVTVTAPATTTPAQMSDCTCTCTCLRCRAPLTYYWRL